MKLSKSAQLLKISGKGLKVAIVFSAFNNEIGNPLLKNTIKYLQKYGVKDIDITVTTVPGALEIPFAANLIAGKKHADAIITLGVVIKGATPHFDLVANECYRGLMQVNLTQKIPVIFGVLTALNPKQAEERASEKGLNKGKEFAEAAIQMARLRIL